VSKHVYKNVQKSLECRDSLALLTTACYYSDSQEVTKEFLDFFMPSVDIEMDPNDKDAVTHVYIRGAIRRGQGSTTGLRFCVTFKFKKREFLRFSMTCRKKTFKSSLAEV